jgi:hypothetical protein
MGGCGSNMRCNHPPQAVVLDQLGSFTRGTSWRPGTLGPAITQFKDTADMSHNRALVIFLFIFHLHYPAAATLAVQLFASWPKLC